MTRHIKAGLAGVGLAILVLLLFVSAQDDPNVGGQVASTSSSSTSSTTVPPTARPGDRANVDGVLRIGTLFPVTGDYLFLRPPLAEGVNLAVAELNAAGGIFGVDVEVVTGDSASSAETAVANADLLLDRERVDIVVGAGTSEVSAALARSLSGRRVVQCAPTSTSPLFEVGAIPEAVRTVPSDLVMARALADLVADADPSTVTILRVADVYSEAVGRTLAGRLAERGVGVDEVAAPAGADGAATARAIISAAGLRRSQEVEGAFVIAALPHVARPLLEQLVDLGLGPNTVPTFGTDGLRSTDLAANLDDPTALDGLRGLGPYLGDANFAERFASFAPNLGLSDFAAQAHDCVTALALAAAAAGSDAAADILEALPRVTGQGGAKCRAMTQCLAFLADGADIDYDGDSGPLEFTDTGEISAGIFAEWSFTAGAPTAAGDRPWSAPEIEAAGPDGLDG